MAITLVRVIYNSHLLKLIWFYLSGYTCDLAAGSCNKKGFLSVVMEGKVPAVKLEVRS